MRMKFVYTWMVFLGGLFCSLAGSFSYGDTRKPNVILVMLDGVRWQEFFHGSDSSISSEMNEPVIFKNIQESLKKQKQVNSGSKAGTALQAFFVSGDRTSGSENSVSNHRFISLPAYQSIMAGVTTSCKTNSCGRVQVETLQEKIRRELKLKKTEVATIASWEEIPNAVEHLEGQTFVNAGVQEIHEGMLDATTLALNRKQSQNNGGWESRKDDYTFAQAVNYVKNNKPRFLFISLNDSDEWAHRGKYTEYVSTLKGYDKKIQVLFDTLGSMGAYGRATTVIVTTDHGRGNGSRWKDHGTSSPESKYFWIYGRSALGSPLGSPLGSTMVKRSGKDALPNTGGYTHLDIRPTIEKLMGLTPAQCEGCGRVIQELIAGS